MKKEDFLIIVIGLVILGVIIIFSLFIPDKVEVVDVITDNSSYTIGDKLKIKIQNNLEEKICFSSCYPYYIEKKNDGWSSYEYIKCRDEDIAENCLDPDTVKAFQFEIPLVEKGTHRVVLPICVGCTESNIFKEGKRFYSNNFDIN